MVLLLLSSVFVLFLILSNWSRYKRRMNIYLSWYGGQLLFCFRIFKMSMLFMNFPRCSFFNRRVCYIELNEIISVHFQMMSLAGSISKNVQGFLNFINKSPTAFHCKFFIDGNLFLLLLIVSILKVLIMLKQHWLHPVLKNYEKMNNGILNHWER